jgi:hypothetical protein
MESISSIINIITDALEEHDLGPSGIGATIDEKGRPVLVLDGLTYDPVTGEVRTAKREYEWTGTVTIEVTVRGTVEAADDDEADELAAEILGSVELDNTPEVSSWQGEITVEDYSTSVYGEVGNVSEA